MNKLEVGMYAYSSHSRDYGVGKIVRVHANGFTHQEVEIQYKDTKISTRYDYVIGSHNPIDLIEVGDYVNGLRVYGVTEYGLEVYMFGDCKETLYENEIETIVTKEQFSKIEYRLGDK